jgi:hypothetical protein
MGIMGMLKTGTTVHKGQITETKLLARLTEPGYRCLVPWGNYHTYDLAIDSGGQLVRIQCKTGRYDEKRGIVLFNTSITYHARKENGTHVVRGYVGEIDYFGVYCPQLNTLYLLPVEDSAKTCTGLRVTASRNGQMKGVLLAKNYEL